MTTAATRTSKQVAAEVARRTVAAEQRKQAARVEALREMVKAQDGLIDKIRTLAARLAEDEPLTLEDVFSYERHAAWVRLARVKLEQVEATAYT